MVQVPARVPVQAVRLSANQARGRRCERNFMVGGGSECSGVATEHGLYKMYEMLICAQSLTCLKSKYLSFVR
jgi:hypothetical protein